MSGNVKYSIDQIVSVIHPSCMLLSTTMRTLYTVLNWNLRVAGSLQPRNLCPAPSKCVCEHSYNNSFKIHFPPNLCIHKELHTQINFERVPRHEWINFGDSRTVQFVGDGFSTLLANEGNLNFPCPARWQTHLTQICAQKFSRAKG